jgi:heterotetrameric sarcosine oxidase delta subunit
MLVIPCPWCGPRDETEFAYGGEADRVQPDSPEDVSDGQWADYLFMRTDSKGRHRERWYHSAGYRSWFNLVRDTTTSPVIGACKPGEPLPGGAP